MTAQIFQPEKIAIIPSSGVEEYIVELAQRHGVTYIKTPDDALAAVITHISDDDVKMDNIELLLIALERAGVVPSANILPLHYGYLKEKFRV